MKLPEITVPVVPLSVTRMPLTALPEMTFQAAVLRPARGFWPPMVLLPAPRPT